MGNYYSARSVNPFTFHLFPLFPSQLVPIRRVLHSLAPLAQRGKGEGYYINLSRSLARIGARLFLLVVARQAGFGMNAS